MILVKNLEKKKWLILAEIYDESPILVQIFIPSGMDK